MSSDDSGADFFGSDADFDPFAGSITPKSPKKAKSQPKQPQASVWDAIVDTYFDDPVNFAKDVLGIEPFEWQAQLMRHVAAGERQISVRAGHGVGKTAGCCILALWFFFTRYPQKTVVTAPVAGQMATGFLPEIQKMIGELRRRFPQLAALIDVRKDAIYLAADPNASFLAARTSSNDRPEALSGIHSDNVLLIVDEASAVPDAVYKNAAGSMSGANACTILISNPTRSAGYYYKTQHDWARKDPDDKGGWLTMHVNCLDQPIVDRAFVDKIIRENGEDSSEYRIRVLGEFAGQDENTLIAAYLVEEAVKREIETDHSAPLILGCDIARFGSDRTVICYRRGNVIEDFKSFRKLDTMEVAGIIAAEAKLHSAAEICVDSIGVGGGVADRLREMGFNCLDVNVSESAAMNPQASRLRDDLWLQVREWLQLKACKIPDDALLREELVTPTYTYNASGKIVVESKDSLRKRMSRSPDLADALCLTFGGQAARVGGRSSAWIPGKPLRRNVRGIV